MANGTRQQLVYYGETAGRYDEWHTACDDEHYFALRHIVFYLKWIEARSALDTGCGTGRAMRYIMQEFPQIRVHGNDPSLPLLRVAAEQRGVPVERLDCATGDHLPYADGSFDVVIATGVLHHVAHPDHVVSEMLRVARKAIFISDCNIYGRGRLAARGAKLVLSRLRMLNIVNRLRRGGKNWYSSEGDGIAYSYSVFDSYPLMLEACRQIIVIPTLGDRDAGVCALMRSSHCLVCGFKEPLPEAR